MDFDDLNYGNLDFGVTQDNFNAKFYVPSPGDCLHCGLCLSSCPTYNLFQNEAETPRQRIRSINKILNENQAITTEELEHLDNCLQCRACEPVCPSKMAYGELFDETQHQLSRPPTLLAKIAFWFIEHKVWRARLMSLVSLYLKSGIQKPVRHSGFLQKLHLAEAEALLTKPVLQNLKARYPSKTRETRGRVGLFTGCIAEQFDIATLNAAIELLTTIGFEVLVPSEQSCCGAIHQHNGQPADHLIANNIEVYNDLNLDAVIFTATGCGAMLSEYKTVDNPSAKTFCGKLTDINDFLLKHWPENLKLKPANLMVAVHEPCSQRNILKNQETVYNLLGKIPGLSVSPLPDNHLCCGAGGSYMLSHPANAGALRAKKAQSFNQLKPDLILSSNLGCVLFLTYSEVNIKHPIQLLADQLN